MREDRRLRRNQTFETSVSNDWSNDGTFMVASAEEK
jgi:hypothetical protein